MVGGARNGGGESVMEEELVKLAAVEELGWWRY